MSSATHRVSMLSQFALTLKDRGAQWMTPLASLLLCVALYFFARPYLGVQHDGVLYLGQTLLKAGVEALNHDMFFAHGSQDRYSIASWLMHQFYVVAGVANSHLLLLAVSQFALLAAAYRWLKPIASPLECWMGVVFLIVMSRLYGGLSIFAFGERFITARTLAEPLLAWSLVFLAERRWLAAVGLGLVGALSHPLLAIPVLVMVWIRGVMADRRVLWSLLLAGPVLVLALLQVKPFAGLLQRFDPLWWDVVQQANVAVFMTRWDLIDHMTLLSDGLILAAAHHFLGPLRRAWWAALIWAAIGLNLLSLIGADLLHNQLLTQLQLWRVGWLSHFLALLVVPALFLVLWRQQGTARVVAMALLASVLGANSRSEDCWPLLIWAALWLWACVRGWQLPSPGLQRILIGVSALLALTAGLQGVMVNLEALGVPGFDFARLGPAMLPVLLIGTPPLILPLALAVLRMAHSAMPWRGGLLLLLLPAVVGGALTWDRRPPWTRYVEEHYGQDHPWRAMIPKSAEVFWHPNALTVWVLLERASFISLEQGAGVLFNRGTAMVALGRGPYAHEFSKQDRECLVRALRPENQSEDFSECFPSLGLVQRLCSRQDSPEFMVFQRRLSKGWMAEWTPMDHHGKPIQTFHLHTCAAFRD